MMNEQFSSLVTKYITGNADEQERQIVQQWIGESQENLDYFISLKEAWHDALLHRGHRLVDSNAAFSRLRSRLQEKVPDEHTIIAETATRTEPVRKSFSFPARVAAAIILLFLAGTGILLYNSRSHAKTAAAIVQIIVPNGRMKQLLLPDGSEVLLNAGSRFRYTEDFGQSNREVSLEGEARFKVRHNNNMPFVVKAGGYSVKDIGTVFTVSAYPGSADFETAVMEGKVEVSGDAGRPGKITSVLLNHNEVLKIKVPAAGIVTETDKRSSVSNALPADSSASVNDATLLEVIRAPQMDKYDGWKNNILVFEDESFENVARRLERTFAVKIGISSQQLAALRYTGKFNKVETIDDALKIIRLTTPILYRVEKDSIIITPGR